MGLPYTSQTRQSRNANVLHIGLTHIAGNDRDQEGENSFSNKFLTTSPQDAILYMPYFWRKKDHRMYT